MKLSYVYKHFAVRNFCLIRTLDKSKSYIVIDFLL